MGFSYTLSYALWLGWYDHPITHAADVADLDLAFGSNEPYRGLFAVRAAHMLGVVVGIWAGVRAQRAWLAVPIAWVLCTALGGAAAYFLVDAKLAPLAPHRADWPASSLWPLGAHLFPTPLQYALAGFVLSVAAFVLAHIRLVSGRKEALPTIRLGFAALEVGVVVTALEPGWMTWSPQDDARMLLYSAQVMGAVGLGAVVAGLLVRGADRTWQRPRQVRPDALLGAASSQWAARGLFSYAAATVGILVAAEFYLTDRFHLAPMSLNDVLTSLLPASAAWWAFGAASNRRALTRLTAAFPMAVAGLTTLFLRDPYILLTPWFLLGVLTNMLWALLSGLIIALLLLCFRAVEARAPLTWLEVLAPCCALMGLVWIAGCDGRLGALLLDMSRWNSEFDRIDAMRTPLFAVATLWLLVLLGGLRLLARRVVWLRRIARSKDFSVRRATEDDPELPRLWPLGRSDYVLVAQPSMGPYREQEVPLLRIPWRT